MALICEKLQLEKGDRVLELGCGWGGFARFAAARYGCSVVAYNISEQQVAYARRWCDGLPVEIVLGDYRNAAGEFDKVAAIERDVSIASTIVASSRVTSRTMCGRAIPTTSSASAPSAIAKGT